MKKIIFGIIITLIITQLSLTSKQVVFAKPHAIAEKGDNPEYLRLSPVLTGRGGKPVRFESEHGAKPERVYRLDRGDLNLKPKAFMVFPQGEEKDLEVEESKTGLSVTVKMPVKGEIRETNHGANNIYVTDKKVKNRALTVRTAKWITIQHSCRWGHDYKYNKKRQTPLSSEKVPLEIVPARLWDGNFHVKTRTGDIFEATVLHYGKPLPGAVVTVRTGKGWAKKLRTDKKGRINFQLIRDYYPKSWEHFKKSQNSRLILLAEYTKAKKGKDLGKPFHKVKYTSSLSWRYKPAIEDYSSYSSGLIVGSLFLLFSAGGIFYYRERRKVPEKDIFLTDRRRFDR